ncbi:hypothetical protein J6590_031113 [Homalodisca vitripennis]|nr:hypothetical protein J6590_031113 [Homalodisca vitripennis]
MLLWRLSSITSDRGDDINESLFCACSEIEGSVVQRNTFRVGRGLLSLENSAAPPAQYRPICPVTTSAGDTGRHDKPVFLINHRRIARIIAVPHRVHLFPFNTHRVGTFDDLWATMYTIIASRWLRSSLWNIGEPTTADNS